MTVDKSSERVRKMFSEIAGSYDFLNHALSLNIDKYWRWRTVKKVAPKDTLPILDVCSGTGDLALAYQRASQGRVPIIGADFCYEMLEVGKQKALKAGVQKNVTFIEADTEDLPFPENKFQIVSVAFGLRNVSNTERGLQEMTRVCAPGGRVAVLEFTSPRRQPLKALYGWYFRHILPRIGQLLSKSSDSAYSYLPESVGEFPQYEALVQKMEAAGLTEVKFYPYTFGVATLYVGHKPQ